MTALSDFLDQEVFPNLYAGLDQLLPEFDLVAKRGYWQSGKNNKLKTDGTHGSSGGAVFVYADRPSILKSFKASSPSRNLVAYLAERDQKPWIEVAAELARQVGKSLPQWQDGTQPQAWKIQDEQKKIWLALESFFTETLLEKPEGKLVLDYLLTERKFPEAGIAEMGLGCFPGMELTKQYLLAHTNDTELAYTVLLALPQQAQHPLAIPVHDPSGHTTGFIFRAIVPNPPIGKYRYSTGYEKAAQLFHFFPRAAQEKPLVLVEGQLDALLLHAKGLGPAAAVGGSSLSAAQWQQLSKAKVQELILAFDADEAGKKALVQSIHTVLDAPESADMRLYIASYPQGAKDPNEVLLQFGEAALQACFQEVVPLHRWLTEHIVHTIGPPFTPLKKDQFLQEAVRYAARIRNPLVKGLFLETLLSPEFTPFSAMGRQTLEEVVQAVTLREEAEKGRRKLLEGLVNASRTLQAGDITAALELLEKSLDKARASGLQYQVKPYSFHEFMQETAAEPADLHTGIHALDAIALIPQSAITLIAARPSHGKTTLMLNMLANMVEKYPEQQFHFFTYEEPAKYLLLKLLNQLLYHQFGYATSLQFLRDYQAGKHPKNGTIEEAKMQLAQRMESRRLNIYSQSLNDLELAATVHNFYQKGKTGAVFIDYIQKIPISQTVKGYEVIKQVSNSMLNKIAVPLQIPLILGAQFNREAKAGKVQDLQADMLREGGDLEQDASLVLGLLNYNFVQDTEDEQGLAYRKGDVAQLDARTLKYRNGVPGKTAHLFLHGKHHYISSMEEDTGLKIF
jgi:DNA primase catalytic core